MINIDLTPAINIIKAFEGLKDGDPSTVRLEPYLCPAGYWTIGWGHSVLDPKGKQIAGSVNKYRAWAVYPKGLSINEAEVLLADDIRRFSAGVRGALKSQATNNQFCALVSFAFNVGVGAFERSTLLRCINYGEIEKVPAQFRRWTKSNGKELAGLKRRREAEIKLWESTE